MVKKYHEDLSSIAPYIYLLLSEKDLSDRFLKLTPGLLLLSL